MNLQKRILNVLLLSGACALTSVHANDSLTFERASSTDIAASSVQEAPVMPLANSSKEPVTFSQELNGSAAIEASGAFTATSLEYRQRVSATQLATGVTIRTSGAGAVVSLSPIGAVKGAGLEPRQFDLTTSDGRVLRGADGMDQLVDQKAIDATGIPFSNGMVGFRINRALGSGEFVLSTSQRASAKDYILNVLDRNSDTSLSLSAAPQMFSGDQLAAQANWQGQGGVAKAGAWLLSPEGRRFPVAVEANNNSLRVQTALPTAQPSSNANGLWELHVTAQDKSGLQRDVKTAFAMAAPTARFDGGVNHQALSFDLGIEVASAGRYSASVALYATGPNGLEPVQMTATAAWLEAGSSELTLSFDADLVKSRGLSAPFELRHLTLQDQSRLAMLHSQERALQIAK